MELKRGDVTYSAQMETRTVAIDRDLTNGARHIEAAKTKRLYIYAVTRYGLSLSRVVTMVRGGRRVKPLTDIFHSQAIHNPREKH